MYAYKIQGVIKIMKCFVFIEDIEGSLEVKIPTICIDEKQKWEE